MEKYFKHKLQNLLVVNKIVMLHYANVDKNFSYVEEQHNFWELVFCENENFICKTESGEIVLSESEMYFHKPNEMHSHHADGENSPTIFIVAFDSRSPAMRFFENKKIKVNKSQMRFIYQIVEEAKKTFDIPFFNPDMKKLTLLPRPTLGGEQLIKNHLELLLIDIMRSLTETEYGNKIFLSENERGNKFISDVIKILKNNVYGRITVDDICKKINYSKAYVFKNFKSATGKSVMDYYNGLKIEKAQSLLLEGELSVKEISEKLCFDTPNYFTKSFKKSVGITPTEYKKRASD